ncbi:MAG TPA: ATP-binding protein [Nitrososphaeraceae archaeon]|nr:ATP-binding protein [Nitrososphaeraceae archaeon]
MALGLENSVDKKINYYLNNSCIIGTIGSPSSTIELSLDILESSVTRQLVGELAIFKYLQDSKNHYAIGQIIEIALKNFLLEDPTIKSVARKRGSVNPISGIQDVHIGKLLCSAIFTSSDDLVEPSLLGTVPPTGTYVYQVDDNILSTILEKQKNSLLYLGNSYGSKTKLPMWFKHFDYGENGAGEAYHLGIFGITGSGKSTLAKMILTAYSKFRQMGLLVLDPVGEFSKSFAIDNSSNTDREHMNSDSSFSIKKIMNFLDKQVVSINVRNLVLDRWSLFEEILLESQIFHQLTIKGPNKGFAVDALIPKLRNKTTLTKLIKRESFDLFMNELRKEDIQLLIFSTPEPRKRLNNLVSSMDERNLDNLFSQYWVPICSLFEDRPDAITIDELLEKFTWKMKPLIVVDLSEQTAHNMELRYWNETIQSLILKRLLKGLVSLGEKTWQKNTSLNTLVVLDEAHRYARKDEFSDSNLEQLRLTLLDAVRTTRKYGLGWLFISTSLSSIHRDILQQLRIMFFGFGLSLGNDLVTLRELVSDEKAIDLYRTFTDPASSFNSKSRKYSFMTQGPVSPLSFSGAPFFFNAFNPNSFITENKLDIKS